MIVRAIRQTVEKRGAPEGLASSKGACGGAAVKMDEKKKAFEGNRREMAWSSGAADCCLVL